MPPVSEWVRCVGPRGTSRPENRAFCWPSFRGKSVCCLGRGPNRRMSENRKSLWEKRLQRHASFAFSVRPGIVYILFGGPFCAENAAVPSVFRAQNVRPSLLRPLRPERRKSMGYPFS